MTQTQFDALLIGRAGMDLYPMPVGATMEEAEHFIPDMGGSAGNIAVAMARQGARVALAAPVSDDPVGAFVKRRLNAENVTHIQGSMVDGEARTSLALAELIEMGSRTVIYRNNAADFGLNTGDLNLAANADLIVVTGTALAKDPSRSASLAALTGAKHGVLDLDYRPYSWSDGEAARVYAEAAKAAHMIVGNDEEFEVLSDGKDPRATAEVLVKQGKTVIFKEGAAGCTWMDPDGAPLFVPAYPVKAMKPFGAGDAFLGTSLVALQRGDIPLEALRKGAAAAALVVTRPGCSSAMPTPDEIRGFRAAKEETP